MLSNDVLKAIQYRRSVFQANFTDEEVSKADILTLLNAANAAPTHKRTQPWRFTVFTGTGLNKLGTELSRIYKAVTPAEKYTEKTEITMGEKATSAQVAIALVVNYTGDVPEWEELAATSCAVQNMWLAAQSLGLGGYWATPGLINHLGDFLALTPNQKCIGIFYLGHHQTEAREPVRSSIEEKVTWIED